MEPHRPKGQASLYDLGWTKRKSTEDDGHCTEDDGHSRELIIRLIRPDVQQAVAARDEAIAASIASLPQLRGLWGGPKCLHHWGCKPLQERGMLGTAATQVEWGGASGALASALHSNSSSVRL